MENSQSWREIVLFLSIPSLVQSWNMAGIQLMFLNHFILKWENWGSERSQVACLKPFSWFAGGTEALFLVSLSIFLQNYTTLAMQLVCVFFSYFPIPFSSSFSKGISCSDLLLELLKPKFIMICECTTFAPTLICSFCTLWNLAYTLRAKESPCSNCLTVCPTSISHIIPKQTESKISLTMYFIFIDIQCDYTSEEVMLQKY